MRAVRPCEVLDRAAIAEYPDSVSPLRRRHRCTRIRDDVDAALRELKQVLKSRPDDPAALNAYGYTLADHARSSAGAHADRAGLRRGAEERRDPRQSGLGAVTAKATPTQALPYLARGVCGRPRRRHRRRIWARCCGSSGERAEAETHLGPGGRPIPTIRCSTPRGIGCARRNERRQMQRGTLPRWPCGGLTAWHRAGRLRDGCPTHRPASCCAAGSVGCSAWPICSTPQPGSSDGRAAAAWGRQGWQASLDWRQRGEVSELHLAGPLGMGAIAARS